MALRSRTARPIRVGTALMVGPLALVCLTATSPATMSAAAASTVEEGLVRLAHLSPDTPAVDVYLYAAGRQAPRLVLRHVGYGALSPYQRLPGGRYTVAMRTADAPATSRPVLSAEVRVAGGTAHTVAGMGPYKGVRLKVLNDTANLAEDRAGLRIIAASLKEPVLDVTAGGEPLAQDLRFPDATRYRPLAAGPTDVRVQGRAGGTGTRTELRAGQAHTVVVLDGEHGLRLVTLHDAPPGATPPGGGVDTGFGGTAPSAGRHRTTDARPLLAAALIATALVTVALAVPLAAPFATGTRTAPRPGFGAGARAGIRAGGRGPAGAGAEAGSGAGRGRSRWGKRSRR